MRRWLVLSLAAGAANVAARQAVTPLEKVVTLLSDLQAKLVVEGEQEATTYDKFACFCKDTMAEKSQAIADGQGAKTTLEADLATATIARDDKDTAIADADKAIADLRGEVEDLTAARREGMLEYEKAEVDLTAAIQSLEAAIKSLAAAKTATAGASLLEVLGPATVAGVRRAVSMAATLGYRSASMLQAGGASRGGRVRGAARLSAESAQDPDMEVFEVPDKVFEFSSGDIATTLEDLLSKFRSKKEELDKQEVLDRKEFDSLVETKEGSIADKQTERDTSKREKAAEAEKIAGLSTDLSTTAAQLLDDQRVLAEVSKKCHVKATLWDQRSKSRADELSALASALSVLRDLAEAQKEPETASAAAAALAQRATSASSAALPPPATAPRRHRAPRRPRLALAASAPAMAAAGGASAEQRARLVSLLRAGASRVHSALLRTLSQQARADPFAKVKQMIQELIERLLKEAASEANHKGWCDKEVSDAEQQRTYAAEVVEELNGQLSTLEARRDQLGLDLETLGDELQEIDDNLANATSLRKQEKAKNAQVIQDAKDGKAAVEKAHAILQRYYRSAAAAEGASLAQVGQAPEEPDAGFDGTYGGAQGAQTGITGMLELIMADFDELAEETAQEEKEAQQEFLELETTLGASRAEKTVAQEQRGKALTETENEHTAAWGKLDEQQKRLDGALTQLLALKPACFDSGMSAEERQAQREAEMASLQQALCILDQHGREGIEC